MFAYNQFDCGGTAQFYFQNENSNVMNDCNYLDCNYCFKQVSNTYIDFKFTIPAGLAYSFIGLDLSYVGPPGINVKFINEYSQESTPLQTTAKMNRQIDYLADQQDCTYGGTLYEALQTTYWVEYTSSSELTFRFYQNIPATLIGIRSVQIWVNCSLNCKKCLSGTECQTCQYGLKTSVVSAPAGTEICEVKFQCNSNCAQCYIANSTNICTICEPGYHLVSTSCVQNVALGNTPCLPEEYINDQGTCSLYSTEALYQDWSRLLWYPFSTTQEYYKCPAGYKIFVFDTFNFDLTFCRLAEGCGGYDIQTDTCMYCDNLYITSDKDPSKCVYCDYNKSYCTYCQVGSESGCTTCYSGFSYDSLSDRCVLPCLANEYFDTNSCQCKTCTLPTLINDLRTGCACPQWQTLNTAGDACICVEWREFDANNECQCVEGRVANAQGLCECPLNTIYDSSKNSCIENKVVLTGELKDRVVTDGYILILEFSNQLKTYPGFENQSVLTLLVNNGSEQQFSFEVTEVTGKHISVLLLPQATFKGKEVSLILTDKTFTTINGIQTLRYEKDLKVFAYLSEGQKNGNSAASTISEISIITIICTIIPIAIFSNFYVLINTIDITGFLYYLLFIDVRYPENVLSFFEFFQNFQFPFIPSMFQNVISSDYVQDAPQKFIDNGFQPYFLSNSGQSVTIVTFILGMYVVGKAFSYVKIPKVQPYLKRAMDETWEFSAFFDLLWSLYIYFLVGSLLQFTVYDDGEENYVINYILHTVFAIIHIGCPFVITYVLFVKKNIKSDSVFKKKFTTLIGGVLLFDESSSNSPKSQELVNQSVDQDNFNLESQNNNPSGIETEAQKVRGEKATMSLRQLYQMKTSKLYNGILYIRKLAFALVIVFLASYPYVQLSLITVLNICMAGYIFYIMPLETRLENIKNGVGEVVLILIQISIFNLVPDDVESSEDDRISIGWLIVSLSGSIMSWHASQMVYEMVKSMYDSVKSLLCKKKESTASQSAKVTPFNSKFEAKEDMKNQVEDLDYPEKSLEATHRIQESQLNQELSFVSGQNPGTPILKNHNLESKLTPHKTIIQNSERSPLQNFSKDAEPKVSELINFAS